MRNDDYLDLGLYENEEPVELWVYGKKPHEIVGIFKNVLGEVTRYHGIWTIPHKDQFDRDATALLFAEDVRYFVIVYPKPIEETGNE